MFCVDIWYKNKNPNLLFFNTEIAVPRINFDVFRYNVDVLGFNDAIIPVVGRSDVALGVFAPNSFDMIFIDGDHRYDAVVNDIKKSAFLLKDGGFLCGDDLNMRYSECDQSAIEKYLHMQEAYIDDKTNLPIWGGVTKAVHDELSPNVSGFCGIWVTQKVSRKFIPVNLKASRFFIPEFLPDFAKAEAWDFVSGENLELY